MHIITITATNPMATAFDLMRAAFADTPWAFEYTRDPTDDLWSLYEDGCIGDVDATRFARLESRLLVEVPANAMHDTFRLQRLVGSPGCEAGAVQALLAHGADFGCVMAADGGTLKLVDALQGLRAGTGASGDIGTLIVCLRDRIAAYARVSLFPFSLFSDTETDAHIICADAQALDEIHAAACQGQVGFAVDENHAHDMWEHTGLPSYRVGHSRV